MVSCERFVNLSQDFNKLCPKQVIHDCARKVGGFREKGLELVDKIFYATTMDEHVNV